jgi:hypothetical protein
MFIYFLSIITECGWYFGLPILILSKVIVNPIRINPFFYHFFFIFYSHFIRNSYLELEQHMTNTTGYPADGSLSLMEEKAATVIRKTRKQDRNKCLGIRIG